MEATKLIAFKVDSDKPTVNITRPADGAELQARPGREGEVQVRRQGEGSGIDTCVGTVPNGSPIDTSTVGTHTFTVTGTDKAGNLTVVTLHYSVLYTWNGFFAPITQLGRAS